MELYPPQYEVEKKLIVDSLWIGMKDEWTEVLILKYVTNLQI
jgi:hypothetical protein